MMTWFTADLHLRHANILKFQPNTRLNLTSIEEHDEKLIGNWNDRVGRKDVIYVLGDFAFTNVQDTVGLFSRLNGNIRLVYGNHDRRIMKSPELFRGISLLGHYHVAKMDRKMIVMFHYPIAAWDRMQYGSYHLFGHGHGMVNVPGKAMDVGIDSRTDMCPWSWDEVREKLDTEPVMPHGTVYNQDDQ